MEQIPPAEATLANTKYAYKSKRLIQLCKDLRDLGLVLPFAYHKFQPDSPFSAADYVSLPSIAVIGSQSGALNTGSFISLLLKFKSAGKSSLVEAVSGVRQVYAKKLE